MLPLWSLCTLAVCALGAPSLALPSTSPNTSLLLTGTDGPPTVPAFGNYKNDIDSAAIAFWGEYVLVFAFDTSYDKTTPPTTGLGLYTYLGGSSSVGWRPFSTQAPYVAGTATVVNTAAVPDTLFLVGGGYSTVHLDPVHNPVANVWRIPLNPNGVLNMPPNPSTWAACAPIPNQRSFHATVTNGTHLITVGGYDKAGVTGVVALYNIAANVWSAPYAPMPTPRYGLAAALVGSRVFAIGGLVYTKPHTPDPQPYSDITSMLDLAAPPASSFWQGLPSATLDHPRGYLSATTFACQIYLMGGSLPDTTELTEVQIMDPYAVDANKRWVWAPQNMTDKRSHFTAATSYTYDYMYAIGGADTGPNDAVKPCPANFTGPTCLATSGRVCNNGYYTPPGSELCLPCKGVDSSNGFCRGPCNGHGACSSTDGSCTCEPFYDVSTNCATCVAERQGYACATCAAGYFGNHTATGLACHMCPGKSEGNVCSGHGTCNGDGGLGTGACDCAEGFTGVDCRECSPGFWGDDCQPCPGSAVGANACSGHGQCDDGKAGKGVCDCVAGFAGAGCQDCAGPPVAPCQVCPQNYTGALCALCPGADVVGGHIKDVCSGRGACTRDMHTTQACRCGTLYGGEDCSQCNDKWAYGGGEDCALCPAVKPWNYGPGTGGVASVVCYYHGKCSTPTAGHPSPCHCGSAWKGESCCEWADCPGSPIGFVGGLTAFVCVALVFAYLAAGLHVKIVLLWFLPSLQLMAALSSYPALRFFAVMAESRPANAAATAWNIPAAKDLRTFLANFGIGLGLDFANWPYLTLCPSPAPPVAALFAVPVVAPLVVLLFLLVPSLFVFRRRRQLAAKEENAPGPPSWPEKVSYDGKSVAMASYPAPTLGKHLLAGVAFACLYLYVELPALTFQVFTCSKEDKCHPNRLLVTCDDGARYIMLGVGVVAVLVLTLGMPAALVWFSGFSARKPRSRTNSISSTNSGQAARLLHGPRTNLSIEQPAKPTRRLQPLFVMARLLKPQFSVWFVVPLLRRFVLVAVFSLTLVPWAAQLATAVVINVVWVLLREYFLLFDDTSFRWYRHVDTALAVMEAAFLSMLCTMSHAVESVNAVYDADPFSLADPPTSALSLANSAAKGATAAAALAVVFVSVLLLWACYQDRRSRKVLNLLLNPEPVPEPEAMYNPPSLAAKGINSGGISGDAPAPAKPRKRRSQRPSKATPPQYQQAAVPTAWQHHPVPVWQQPGGAAPAAAQPEAGAQVPPGALPPEEVGSGAGSAAGPQASPPVDEAKASPGVGTPQSTMTSPGSVDVTGAPVPAPPLYGVPPAGWTDSRPQAYHPRQAGHHYQHPRTAGPAAAGPAWGAAPPPPSRVPYRAEPAAMAKNPILSRTKRRGKGKGKGRRKKPLAPTMEDDVDDLDTGFGRGLSPPPPTEPVPYMPPPVATGAPDLVAVEDRVPKGSESVLSGFSSVSHGLHFEEEASCLKCGVAVLASSNFCHRCGADVSWGGPTAPRPPAE